jgi:hypothetical protein
LKKYSLLISALILVLLVQLLAASPSPVLADDETVQLEFGEGLCLPNGDAQFNAADSGWPAPPNSGGAASLDLRFR